MVPLKKYPTAKQLAGLVHVTPKTRLFWLGDVLGLGTIDHTLPFQDSTSVWVLVPLLKYPTAKQLAGLVHVTPKRALSWLGDVLGLATMDHTLPFQDSMSVCLLGPLEELPTAKQLVGLVHATPWRRLA